nr:FimB/Mfa2 family fimbrial subunit [uncultured Prevotella sp.]
MKILHYKMLIALCALGTMLWSCDSFIYDGLKHCPQGVYVNFYSKTPCASDTTFIGSVPSLTVFAFDENDKLVTSVTEKNVNLDRDYSVLMPVSNGNFTFIAWAGVDDKFTTSNFIDGTTTKKDVMLTLKSASNTAPDLSGTRLWQGESSAVYLPDPDKEGTVYKKTAINLSEMTNRVTVKVELDETVLEDHVSPKDFAIGVTSADGTMNIDGSMPLNGKVWNYPALSTQYTDNSVTWNFAMTDLKTGYNNLLTLSDPAENKTLFSGDLIGSILLLYEQQTNINMACQHDFAIRFILKDCCASHFSCDILVNNWLVHSYDTELGL